MLRHFEKLFCDCKRQKKCSDPFTQIKVPKWQWTLFPSWRKKTLLPTDFHAIAALTWMSGKTYVAHKHTHQRTAKSQEVLTTWNIILTTITDERHRRLISFHLLSDIHNCSKIVAISFCCCSISFTSVSFLKTRSKYKVSQGGSVWICI